MSEKIADFYAKITADFADLQKGVDEAKKKLDGLGKQSSNTGGAVDVLSGKLSGLINPTTLMVSAVTGLTVYLRNATAAAAESAQVDAKLAAVLKATGNAAGLSADELDDMASSLSKVSGVDDEVVKNGAAVLATFREIGSDVFPQAMQAALDMSAVMGTDLQASIVQIGKALNDPIAGVSALRKVGVQLTDQQKEQIKTFMESGDIMKAQAVILQELGMEFGGAAETMNDAGDGSANLKVSIGNLTEWIGSKFLPIVQDANKETSSWIDKIVEEAKRNDEAADSFHNQFEAGRQVVDLFYEGAKTNQYYTNAVMKAGQMVLYMAEADKSAKDDLDALNQSTVEATMTQEGLNAQLGMLASYMSTDLSDAQESYNEKIAEYTKQLEEARTAEEREGIQAKIDAETEAYNRRAASIIFNIQQEALLAQAQTPEQMAAVLPILTQLADSYGLIDEKQVQLMGTTNNLIALWSSGAITTQQFTDGMMNVGKSAFVASDAEAELAQKTYNVTQKAVDATAVLPKFDEAQTALGGSIRNNALPAVKGLANGLSSMPLTGTTWTYMFNIITRGKVPSVPKRGNYSGPGAGYENNAGVDSEFGASGGQWSGGWLVVGDAPGGQWTPFTEVVSPSGYVYNAEEARILKNAGVLNGATSLAGGGYGLKSSAIMREGTPHPNVNVSPPSGSGSSVMGEITSSTPANSAVVSELGRQQTTIDTLSAAITTQALTQTMQATSLNKKLDELIGVMSANPRAIGNEISFQLSRRS